MACLKVCTTLSSWEGVVGYQYSSEWYVVSEEWKLVSIQIGIELFDSEDQGQSLLL